MPNWCVNFLSVTGDEELLEKFHDENEGDDQQLSFNKAVPLDDDDDGVTDNMKNINMWGTKWDAGDVCCDEIGRYEFDTAWSPPIPWFEAIVVKYPELNFELWYSEQGMDFSGVIKGTDGEIYMNDDGDYGEYHGLLLCECCCDAFKLDKICTKYHECICYDCLEEKKDIITDCIINIKKKRLPFKNACNRISRNPIFDQFLMRKVFVKRVEEIF